MFICISESFIKNSLCYALKYILTRVWVLHTLAKICLFNIFHAKKLKKGRKCNKIAANLKQNYAEIKSLSLHPNASEGFIPRKPSTSIWVKLKIHIFANFASIFLLFTLFQLLAQKMLKKQISILFGVRST